MSGELAPLVSVIMPVYNGEKYLAEAIDSALAQTFMDFELLIVDDGSQDDSAEIIRAYLERDNRIRFIKLERNAGQGPALNAGLAVARGRFITTMDCDDVSLPQRLERQVSYLRANPCIGAVGACATVMNHDLTAVAFEFKVPPQHALIVFNLFFGASFVGATIMSRGEFIEAVGGYTSDRALYTDLDLSMRLLWNTPIRFANMPDTLMLYRRHDSAMTVASLAEFNPGERKIRACMLHRLWGEAPEDALDRFQRLRYQHKLGWAERRATKKDLRRLIESLIRHNLVESGDRSLLLAAMNRRLELASPRRWQQFMHWKRRHFRRKLR